MKILRLTDASTGSSVYIDAGKIEAVAYFLKEHSTRIVTNIPGDDGPLVLTVREPITEILQHLDLHASRPRLA